MYSQKSLPAYNPQAIEPKWQAQWEADGLYLAGRAGDRPKYYCLDFFPYPSGDGLHVGHCRNYVPTDVVSRFKRMQGYDVLHPMGWDAFGEPTEQYAQRHNIHPRQSTDQNTANFRRQFRIIGASYDWSREIDSSQPEFYRWTQWFFVRMYQRGLAYRDTNLQWWCPTCQTTLSSHEAVGGVCWRGHTGITRREIPAWYLKITAYADELLNSLEEISWPEHIKSMQRNWIGRSEGVNIHFGVPDKQGIASRQITVFTTRTDTLYGATFLVLAPEHEWVEQLTQEAHIAEVQSYRDQAARMGEVARMVESREKTGVFTGGYAIHPLSGERLPIWVADYVLPGYGTGAVMGVPAHDMRDFEFAKRYHLPVRVVIVAPGIGTADEQPQQADTGDGYLVNSGEFNGLSNQEAALRITERLVNSGLGEPAVQYHMRDWLISRQRYWGTPIPIVYCSQCGEVPVPEEQLPVLLPEIDDFRPDGSGRSPLARLESFVNTTCPRCNGPAQRETDTMGGFACSSWYFLRFTSPYYHEVPYEEQAMRYWMPVDLYVGGAEHAVLHLLYARFWTQVLADLDLLPFREPFPRLLNQGQMLAPDGQRMSKSRGNVITPDRIVEAYGADALRVYVMFMAPFEQDADWTAEGINGARRFLNRTWALYRDTYFQGIESQGRDAELERWLHRTIRQVTERIESFRLNTLISALMEFSNALGERHRAGAWRTQTFHQALETLLCLLAPAAPHLAEELWQLTGHEGSVHTQVWPAWDRERARRAQMRVAVQVDGKLRAVLELALDASEENIRQTALEHPRVAQHLAERKIIRAVYIPGKVLNLVTGDA